MTSTLNLTDVDAAANAFDVETRVPRALFKLLDESGEAPNNIDPEAMFQAGRALTEAAERLLAVLLTNDE